MSVPTKPGNTERGWNDPPVFLHSPNAPTTGENNTAGKRTLLTKRVAHTGLYGSASNNPTVLNDQPSDAMKLSKLPPLICPDVSKPSEITASQLPNHGVGNVSPTAGVVLFPPTTTTTLPRYTAPIIVPTMSPVEKDPGIGSPTATNPITNTQINLEDAENSLGIPNFDNDEQMFHYVLAKLQKTLIDVQGTLQPKVIEDVTKKLEILSSMWSSGCISYPVKSSMTRLATALHQRKCDEAHQIHMALMMDSISEVGQWMVGVKRLIQEARSAQPASVGSPLSTHAPVELTPSTNQTAEPVTLLNPVSFSDTAPLLTVASVDNNVTPPAIGVQQPEVLSEESADISCEEENGNNETEPKTDHHQSE